MAPAYPLSPLSRGARKAPPPRSRTIILPVEYFPTIFSRPHPTPTDPPVGPFTFGILPVKKRLNTMNCLLQNARLFFIPAHDHHSIVCGPPRNGMGSTQENRA